MRLATFNARAETVQTKPFFKEAFKRSRCLIPASGYYEWHYSNPNDKKEKPQPYYFTRRDGQPITFAGLYDTWHDKADNKNIQSCAVVIAEPNKIVAEVHDRMPVILERDQFDTWMRTNDVQEAAALLKPAPEDVLVRRPVSKRLRGRLRMIRHCSMKFQRLRERRSESIGREVLLAGLLVSEPVVFFSQASATCSEAFSIDSRVIGAHRFSPAGLTRGKRPGHRLVHPSILILSTTHNKFLS